MDMAINFSAASFAACLAAGLKVPQQIMYCIAQDTNTPYVLYKDNGLDRTAEACWTAQSNELSTPAAPIAYIPPPPPLPLPPPPSQQQQTVPHHPQKQQQPDQSTTPPHESSTAVQQQHTSTMTSPVPSPYGPNADDDRQQQQQSSPPTVCFPGKQQDFQQQYRPGPMLSPTTFMHYLKQPASNTNNGIMVMGEPLPENANYANILNEMRGGNDPLTERPRQFKCTVCGKEFKQKSTLVQHERIHTDARPFACTHGQCSKRFRQQSHLTQHVRIHANEKPFACAFCERTFRQRAILNQHLRIHSGEKPFVCTHPRCGKPFRQKAILNQHARTHQDVGPQLLLKTNGENSATLWEQDGPYPRMHEEDNNNVQTQTDEPIQYTSYYKDSKTLPSQGGSMFVRCPICQKEFKQKSSTLLQHGCVHIESRPYPCVDCGKRFRQQSHLTQHLRIHTNEKPYACVCCGRHFRQRTILNQHLRIHTGEKPYRCLECGKDFRQKAILDQHTRTHQGERPFCCPMPNCRRRFSVEHDLNKHLDNHMHHHHHHSNISKQRQQHPIPQLHRSRNNNSTTTAAAPPAITPPTPPFTNSSVPQYIKPELYFHAAAAAAAAAAANFAQFTNNDYKPQPVISAQ